MKIFSQYLISKQISEDGRMSPPWRQLVDEAYGGYSSEKRNAFNFLEKDQIDWDPQTSWIFKSTIVKSVTVATVVEKQQPAVKKL